MTYDPCSELHEAWKGVRSEWKEANNRGNEAIEDYAIAGGTAVAACYFAGFANPACGITIWAAWDKFWDAKAAVDAANALVDDANSARSEYYACVADHKHALSYAGDLGEAEELDEPDEGDIPDVF